MVTHLSVTAVQLRVLLLQLHLVSVNEVCCTLIAFSLTEFFFLTGKTMITSKSWDLKSDRETVESIPKFSVAGHNDFELFWKSDDY